MNWTESEEEETGSPFRILFSEEETGAFFRPVVELPTRRIAFWSIGLSILLALALIFSSRSNPNRLKNRLKPASRFGKGLVLRPFSPRRANAMAYLRQ